MRAGNIYYREANHEDERQSERETEERFIEWVFHGFVFTYIIQLDLSLDLPKEEQVYIREILNRFFDIIYELLALPYLWI